MMTDDTEQNIWYLRLIGEMHARYGFTADELENSGRDGRRIIFEKYNQALRLNPNAESVDPADFPHTFWIDPPMAGPETRSLNPPTSRRYS